MRWKQTDLPHVLRQEGESFDGMLRRFTFRARSAGIIKGCKERRHFVPPSELRRLAKREGRRRARQRAK